jgi:hypothetical protein
MTRYKGRVSAKTIERDFPHVVETIVPEGGLGKTLDAMHEFHTRHKIEAARQEWPRLHQMVFRQSDNSGQVRKPISAQHEWLRILRDLCQMRLFLRFVGFPFVLLYADEMFYGGQITEGAVKMFSEMALWMHLTG